jgi:hypothetical protein
MSGTNFSRFTLRALLFVALLLIARQSLLITAFAQSATATLSGTVTDQNGAVVPGVEITIINRATGLQRQATTGEQGEFTVPLLPPSTYTVRIQHTGFSPIEYPSVILNVGDQKALKIELKAGDVNATVQVTTDAQLINESPAVGTVVDRRLVQNLPLNGRTFQSLLTLTPGVSLVNASSSSDGGQLSVNGQRGTANYFTVDGVSANVGINYQNAGGTIPGTSALGATNSLVSVDAVEEFRVQTSSYAPEFGRTPGGQFQIVTRSGTNGIQGSVFEYLRNDVFDATDWFVNRAGARKPALRLNNFGGTVGGTILRNRTFFFFSYEGQRIRQPLFAITSVPSDAARQAASGPSQAILKAYPISNGPALGNNLAEFHAGYSNPASADSTSIRLDHRFSSKLTAFGRYSHAPSNSIARGVSFALSSGVNNDFHAHALTMGLSYQITPALFNDLRLNVNDSSVGQIFFLDNFGGAQPIPDSLLFPAPLSAEDTAITISATFPQSSLRVGTFTLTKQRQLNIVEGLLYATGAHQIKVGIDYRRLLPFYGGFQSPIYRFNDVAGMITNTLVGASFTTQRPARAEVTNFSAYAQDSWKVRRRLLLTYGLRWDVTTPPHTLDGPNNYVPLLGDPANPSSIQVGPLGGKLWEPSYRNFAPRLGMALTLSEKAGRELVLRVGGGVFFDIGIGNAALAPFFSSFPNEVTRQNPGASFPLTPAQLVISRPEIPGIGSRFQMFDEHLKLPRTYQWNVSVQQSLGRPQTFTMSYVGALGRSLLRSNSYPVLTSQSYGVTYTNNEGTSDYHALQLEFQRRLSRGISGIVSYTWAHSIDTGSSDVAGVAPSGIIDVRMDRGPSDFDLRHSLNVGISYDLPRMRSHGWLNQIVGGWGLDSIFVARSASPVNVTSIRNAGFGTLFLRPDVVPGIPIYLYGSQFAGGKVINRAAFTIPTSRQGNLGRNALRGFPLTQLDLSLRRRFQIRERLGLQFRVDMFNIFNHPNFGNPVSNLTSAQFGQSINMMNGTLGSGGAFGGLSSIFQPGGPRSIQLSLKVQF